MPMFVIPRAVELPSTEGLSTPEDIARWRAEGYRAQVEGAVEDALFQGEQTRSLREVLRLEREIDAMLELCRANGVRVDMAVVDELRNLGVP